MISNGKYYYTIEPQHPCYSLHTKQFVDLQKNNLMMKCTINLEIYHANQNKPTLCLTYVLTGFLEKII